MLQLLPREGEKEREREIDIERESARAKERESEKQRGAQYQTLHKSFGSLLPMTSLSFCCASLASSGRMEDSRSRTRAPVSSRTSMACQVELQ